MGAATLQSRERIPSLGDATDALRRAVSPTISEARRTELGQFFTPAPVARLMASLFHPRAAPVLHLLDAGAGIGSLSAAWVDAVCEWPEPPGELVITAYELDADLLPHLHRTFAACAVACTHRGITFRSRVRQADFIGHGVALLHHGPGGPAPEQYDCAILNPPYRKIRNDSAERLLLRGIGVETSNLYTGFLSIVMRLLGPGGELVAITPRSWCNGAYFRAFRRAFLDELSPRQFHLFGRRDRAFRDDAVLQETLITHAVKTPLRPATVLVSTNRAPGETLRSQVLPYERVVRTNDADRVIHLVEDEGGKDIAARMDSLPATLESLGLHVSTGPVVDFRAREHLRPTPGPGTVPLLWAEHCTQGRVHWPKVGSDKPQAIVCNAQVERHLVPSGTYVLVKRFSAKEEPRRIVAVVLDGRQLDAALLGIENHLNYYHRGGAELEPSLARGLALFLNSTLVDQHFRQFSGHTQVNAADLRRMRYPAPETLAAWGACVGNTMPNQEAIDAVVNGVL